MALNKVTKNCVILNDIEFCHSHIFFEISKFNLEIVNVRDFFCVE